MKAEIAGSEGSIFIHPRWHETQGFTIAKDGDVQKFNLPKTGKGYSHEIKEVHSCITGFTIGESALVTPAQ